MAVPEFLRARVNLHSEGRLFSRARPLPVLTAPALTVIVPLSISSRALIVLSKVLLPAPLGPMMQVVFPLAKDMDKLSKTTLLPNDLVTLVKTTDAVSLSLLVAVR